MTPGLLFVALLLDAVLGEPRWLWSRLPHPAVLMGRGVDAADRRWNRGGRLRLKGALALAALAAATAAAAALVAALPLGWLWQTLGAAVLLAQRSLVDHVRAVAAALDMSLSEGRGAVAQIVGRDTARMDRPDVARAAIESAAENFSDGVVAPTFWFLVAGLPGIAVYKLVNTADSMIGHRTPRHAQFGWAAARLDDLLNLVPARLAALLIALATRRPALLRRIGAEARLHRSPNAGWPEAAMAAGLGVALSGPRSYDGRLSRDPFVNPAGRRDTGPADIRAAVRLLWRAWAALLALAGVLALL